MAPDLHIFKAQVGMFDPTHLQDHNVAIHYQQNVYYRRVDFLEGIPPFQCINLGALAAATLGNRQNIVNLEMADNEFGLFRWYPIDDAQILFFHPAGLSKFQLRNLQVPVEMNIHFTDPNLVSTEIAVWEDNRPAAQAMNGHAVGLGAVRIRALGYRFHTLEFEDPLQFKITYEERKVIAQMKTEPGNQKEKDADLMVLAIQQRRIPVTDVWCSGRGIGD